MMGGIFSAIGFNFSDTYFVSKLGAGELAAMSFTFPVVMVLFGISFGLGSGTTSIVARAIGSGRDETVRRITSDSLGLSFLVVLVVAGLGMLTINPLFTALGATADVLPLIRRYMLIWYLGVVFLVVLMFATAAIRATGDTRLPALMMIGATGFNILLDPLLIFGLWGLPRLGLEGAAIATVIARATTFFAALNLLHFRVHLLDFHPPKLGDVWSSWKQVGSIALPATATNLFLPIALGTITRLVAEYGPEAVAAWGAGSRIGTFAMIPVYGACSGLVPFVGQNWGAGEYARVYSTQRYTYIFSLVWSILMVVVLHLGGAWVAGLFATDDAIVAQIALYLSIIPLGFAMQGIAQVNEESLNSIGKPLSATLQTIVHQAILYIAFAFIGAEFWGLRGLFAGLVAADLLGGRFSLWLVRWVSLRSQRQAN
jgi:putative MATE family efflux protein